jgi:probable phosphoglycerate mutase
MSTVFVIRPGETEFDQQARIQGDLDLPLSDRGRQQVSDVIERLRGKEIGTIYASTTEPARSTARAIGESLGAPVKELDELGNLNQGLWQGLLLEEIKRKQPRVYKQWRDAPGSVCAPQGETCDEAHERVRKALRRPMKKRAPFAVVASEPLATLICCVLRGTGAQLPGPVCGCDDARRVEVIDDIASVNGHSTPPLESAANGSNH